MNERMDEYIRIKQTSHGYGLGEEERQYQQSQIY